MSTSTSDDVLTQTVALLWPGPAGTRTYRVLPSAAEPRFLVPEQHRRAASAGLRAVRESGSRRARLQTSLVCAALRTAPTALLPGARVAVGEDGIDRELSEVVGAPVHPTVHLGPARANRKPVLSLASDQGRLLGFAKVGAGPLTAALVEAEAQALDALAGVDHPGLTTPRLLGRGAWQGQPYAVQSPLALPARPPAAAPRRVAAAQVALARAFGTHAGSAGAGTYLSELVARLRADETGAAIAQLVLDDPAVTDTTVELGTWHGDWRVTNFCATASTVLVWDWERFATGVPVGYDALHLWLTTAAPRHADLQGLAKALHTNAPTLLDPFGLDGAQAEVTTTLYLAELGARYLADRQHETSARLGDVATWILPHLQQRAEARRR